MYHAYAARLVARLPKPTSGSLSGSAVLGASDWHVRLSDEDISVVCLIVSTAEHCQVGGSAFMLLFGNDFAATPFTAILYLLLVVSAPSNAAGDGGCAGARSGC